MFPMRTWVRDEIWKSLQSAYELFSFLLPLYFTQLSPRCSSNVTQIMKRHILLLIFSVSGLVAGMWNLASRSVARTSERLNLPKHTGTSIKLWRDNWAPDNLKMGIISSHTVDLRRDRQWFRYWLVVKNSKNHKPVLIPRWRKIV